MSTHKSTDYKFSAVEYYLNTDNIVIKISNETNFCVKVIMYKKL
jgi:hypothetical protein